MCGISQGGPATGQKVIVFLKGTLLTTCCAATGAVLFVYDLTRVPFERLDHWWGQGFVWVIWHAGDCSFDEAGNVLFGDNNDILSKQQRAKAALPRRTPTDVQPHDAGSSTNNADYASASRRS